MSTTLLVGVNDGLHVFGDEAETHLAGRRVMTLDRDGDDWWAITDRRTIWRRQQHAGWEPVAEAAEFEAACLLPVKYGAWIGTYAAHLFHLNDGWERNQAFDESEGRERWFTPWGGPPETHSLARSSSGTLYANIHVGGILRSRDNGASWQPTIEVRSDVHQVLVHPDYPDLVLAPSGRGLGLSRDGGDSWEFITAGLHGRYCRAVAVSGNIAYMTASTGSSSRQGAVYRLNLDHPTNFERCRYGLPEWTPSNIDTFCLTASGPAVAFGTNQGTVYLSQDHGETWDTVSMDLAPVRCVAMA